jgi:lipopolysaccharide export LptBFGC system permease protein LptF
VFRRFFAIAGCLAFFVFFVALSSLGSRLSAPALWGMFGMALVIVALFAWSFISKAMRKA